MKELSMRLLEMEKLHSVTHLHLGIISKADKHLESVPRNL